MRRLVSGGVFSAIKRPLSEAVELLAPHRARIHARWRRRLGPLAGSRTIARALARLDAHEQARAFHAVGLPAFAQALTEQGEFLASSGVSEELVLAASLSYLEECLPHLNGSNSSRCRVALALTVFVFASQLFLIAGYRRRRSAEQLEITAQRRRAEERLRNISVEIGDFYEQERRRLAHDLHDEIGHDLIVLKLYTEMLGLDLKEGSLSQVRQKLKEAVALVEHALQSVRRVTFELGPPVWEEAGFVPTLRLYARQFESRTGIRVKLRAARVHARLPASYETALYRVLQSALSNVAEHAHAKNVSIDLAGGGVMLRMSIRDDGVGFNVDHRFRAPHRGFGLRAMRERIEALGGTLRIESRPARSRRGRTGTTVEVELPRQDRVRP